MLFRRNLAACILSKFSAAFVIVCLFACSLPAVAGKPLPSMSTQDVHDVIAKLGVGKSISGRASSSGPGPIQYTGISGKIASISDASFGLSIKKGHKVTVQTYAYKDVDEIHGTNVKIGEIVVEAIVVAAVFFGLVEWQIHS